ncbi:MAG: DUF2459 domain-containing protein [Caulobacteraceae bacterium]|nr:DUF2459 domain-containing protein [Caulobacteraceae bacterium]
MARPRRSPRRRGLPILGLILAVGALLILATSRAGDARLYPLAIGVPRTTVYLIDNGLHSDIALPRQALAGDPVLARAAAMTTGAPWLMIGWGDERFYTGQGLSLARIEDGARAVLWPRNRAVVHLEGVADQPDMAFVDANARPIEVSDAGLARMVARIDRSLARGADGAPVRIAAPVGADEAFFLSSERFDLTHLCNHWTAEVLNAAGLPVNLALDTLPAGLRLDLAVRSQVPAEPNSSR